MRIKYSLLPKLRNLTNKEMDFFLCIAKVQDISGNIYGVHYKYICKKTGMCKQSFYNSLRSLSEKGIITYEKKTESDYDIVILRNDFSYPESFKEGYVNLHRQVFHQKKFQKLKANEKYLLMELLKRTHENRSSYQVGVHNFYKIFREMLGVTSRVLRYYIHSLKEFFSIGIKDKKYYMTYRHSVFSPMQKQGVEEQEFEYFVATECRRNRLQSTQQELADTANLLKQYRPMLKAEGKPLSTLKQMLAYAIRINGENSKLLNCRYVHTILKQSIIG